MRRNFLTGATGFIGAAICAEIWRRGQAGEWLLLVRATGDASAKTRLENALTSHLGAHLASHAASAFAIMSGDLLDAPWGDDDRLKRVESIVHLAANTSFRTTKSVWLVNVDGTLAIAAIARRLTQLRRFVYVGTAFRCGAAPAFEILDEGTSPGPDASHFVEYTRSKAAAELALHEHFRELPLIVALPSIVAGHSTLGCGTGASIFWYFRVLDRMGAIPCEPDAFIDVVPVDWAAEALLHLALTPTLAHQTYHVSAGQIARTSLSEMARQFAALGHGGNSPWQAFDQNREWAVARDAFHLAFPERDAVTRAMLGAAKSYCRFVAQGLTFSNERLLAQGVAPAPSLPTYMDRCLTYPGSAIRDMFLDDAGVFGLRPQT